MSDFLTEQEINRIAPVATTERMRTYHVDNNFLIVLGESECELIVSPEELQELRVLLDKTPGYLKTINEARSNKHVRTIRTGYSGRVV